MGEKGNPNHTGDANGGSGDGLPKPMDKDPHQYRADETVPPDTFHEEPLDESLMENHGSFAKQPGS